MIKVIGIVRNIEKTYPGDLEHYFRVIWHAPNIVADYHNISHMLHVTWATYQGWLYYKHKWLFKATDDDGVEIDGRTLRNMLIAALFHDYNHSGEKGDDALNIKASIKGLKAHILPMDEPFFDEICSYIRATQFPHIEGELSLPAKIIRDADITYTLGDVWIQRVNFGLNKESGMSTKDMLKGQEYFFKNLFHLSTEWAEKEYGTKVQDRIQEANEMAEVIYGK